MHLFSQPQQRTRTQQNRALLVLRWFLASLKNQQYGGRDEKDGVKIPLNAFLGEGFLASWDAPTSGTRGNVEARLASEQVPHQPPVTGCFLWNDAVGLRAEGYTCQEISFNGATILSR
jgi:hypothetical protein